MNRDRLFHYVRISEVERWLACGWMAHASLDGCHHGNWSVLMERFCDCEPSQPDTFAPALDGSERVHEHHNAPIR